MTSRLWPQARSRLVARSQRISRSVRTSCTSGEGFCFRSAASRRCAAIRTRARPASRPEPVVPVRTQSRRQGRACTQLRARARARSADDHARVWSPASQPAHPRARRRERLAGRKEAARRAFPVSTESGRPGVDCDGQDRPNGSGVGLRSGPIGMARSPASFIGE